eukprot:2672851-Amphidinium_carterae.1
MPCGWSGLVCESPRIGLVLCVSTSVQLLIPLHSAFELASKLEKRPPNIAEMKLKSGPLAGDASLFLLAAAYRAVVAASPNIAMVVGCAGSCMGLSRWFSHARDT